MSRSKIIGTIEIGTSKVAIVIAELQQPSKINILGYVMLPSLGVKKGEVLDYKSVCEYTHEAIAQAEKVAGTVIERVYLAQTGSHIKGFFNSGTVNVAASNNMVSVSDIERATREAKNKQLSEDRVYLHHIQNGFELDGRHLASALNMEGRRLAVGYWSIHGDVRKVRDFIHIINGYGLQVEDIIISSLASGNMVIDDAEKQNGVLVVDIGAGTTDYVLYANGYVQRTGVIPVGGDHITNDLCLGLRVSREHAERLKIEEGKAEVESHDKDSPVWLIGDRKIGDRSIPRESLNRIIELRVEELFSIIRKDLEGLISLQKTPCGVVLTGGTSQLRRITTLASQVLGLDARVGELQPWVLDEMRKPELATVLGLLQFAAGSTSGNADTAGVQSSRGFVKKIANLFTFAKN